MSAPHIREPPLTCFKTLVTSFTSFFCIGQTSWPTLLCRWAHSCFKSLILFVFIYLGILACFFSKFANFALYAKKRWYVLTYHPQYLAIETDLRSCYNDVRKISIGVWAYTLMLAREERQFLHGLFLFLMFLNLILRYLVFFHNR